ncbi:MAG: DegT/DnrJ/EryC1/StrS aminotransferase family protein [Burkholderiales bacterium]|nr:DegT/DnrJ/EryC1/StrS aminotransferase family protein [Burkholderiales bacterium]
MNPPFLPFTRPSIDEETIAQVCAVLRSGWITSGPQVKAFEAELSAHCGGRPVRVFSSGTSTMEVALRLAGIGPGDEVITTPLSWVATANVILAVGARPVFVDVDPATRNIDLNRIEAAITPKTRALLPVDLAGLPVDRARLYALAERHGLRVIEDAAQSFGARWNGRPIGAEGDFASFSFHPNKNVTSIEGGALVLPADIDPALAERWRLQGVARSGFDGMEVDVPGGKFNLTDVAACVGRGQLKRLEEFTSRRRHLARTYFDTFDLDLGCDLPVMDWQNCNWHMFQIVLPQGIARPAFMQAMQERGIGTGVHYPAMHLFRLYRDLGYGPGMFPRAERIGAAIVTLPLFPAMVDADVERVCAAVRDSITTLKTQGPT